MSFARVQIRTDRIGPDPPARSGNMIRLSKVMKDINLRSMLKLLPVLLPVVLLALAATNAFQNSAPLTPEDSLEMMKEADESIKQLKTGLDGTPQGWNLIMLAAKRLYSLGRIATPGLLKVATSKKANPITRKMAIEIVSDLRDTRAIGPFVAIARDKTNPPGVRHNAAYSLGYVGTDEVVDSLLTLIASADRLLKSGAMTGIRAASNYVDVGKALEPIVQIIEKTTDVGLRREAILALGAFRSKGIPLLTQLLENEDEVIRSAALHGLSGTRSSVAVRPLVKLLSSDDQKVRTDAIMALEYLGDTSAVPALIEMLPRGGHDASDAARALAAIGDPRALEPLREAIGQARAEGKEPGFYMLNAYKRIKKRQKANTE